MRDTGPQSCPNCGIVGCYMDVQHWIETVQNLLSLKQSEPANERAKNFKDSVLFERLKETSGLTAKDLMIQRPLVYALDADLSLENVLKGRALQHTHIPVYRGDMDNILGLITARDLSELAKNPLRDGKLEDVLQPIHSVPETMGLMDLLDEFAKLQTPLLVAKNDQGTTVGIVELRDVLEVLFGLELSDNGNFSQAASV